MSATVDLTSVLASPPDDVLARCAICGGADARVVSRDGVLYNRLEELTTLVSNLCVGCGVVYTSPRLSRATLERFYDREQSGRRTVRPLAELIADPVTAKAAGRLGPVLPRLAPNARVLEIGAGDCRMVAAFARQLPDGVVTGLDAAFAGDSAPVANVRLVSGRLDDRTTPAALAPPYDCIAAFHVLEHQHDPIAFLTRVAALLAPGGVIYLEVPNTYRPWWLGKSVEVFFCTVHLFNYGRRALDALLRAAGLEPLAWESPAKALRVVARAGATPSAAARPLTAADVAAIQRYFAWWRRYSRWRRAPGLGGLAPLAARPVWAALAPALERAVR